MLMYEMGMDQVKRFIVFMMSIFGIVLTQGTSVSFFKHNSIPVSCT